MYRIGTALACAQSTLSHTPLQFTSSSSATFRPSGSVGWQSARSRNLSCTSSRWAPDPMVSPTLAIDFSSCAAASDCCLIVVRAHAFSLGGLPLGGARGCREDRRFGLRSYCRPSSSRLGTSPTQSGAPMVITVVAGMLQERARPMPLPIGNWKKAALRQHRWCPQPLSRVRYPRYDCW